MTPQEEARLQAHIDIHIAYPNVFTDAQIDVLLAEGTMAEKTSILAALSSGAVSDPVSFWARLLEIVNVVEQVCNVIIPVAGAIQAIRSL
jgi:hypothetical protein